MYFKSKIKSKNGEQQTAKTRVIKKNKNSSWSGEVTYEGKTTSVEVNSISNLLARCAVME